MTQPTNETVMKIATLLKEINGIKPVKAKTKIVISTPLPLNSIVFANLLFRLGDLNSSAGYQYDIDICRECEDCGALNDTVRPIPFHKSTEFTEALAGKFKFGDQSIGRSVVFLCDYCVKKREK